MPHPQELSFVEARRLAVNAQGLSGPRPIGGTLGVLHRLGAVQLDTISVLARSHLLVPWARLGSIDRLSVEDSYWSATPNTFEYWAHAACILPIDRWPLFSFRRRLRRAKGRRWHHLEEPQRKCQEVVVRLRSEGPLTATELGGAKAGGPWWDWTDTKIAVEWLLDIGDVVCTSRKGWRRVYDLTERAIPRQLQEIELDDETCLRELIAIAARSMGIASARQLGEYYAIPTRQVELIVADMHLVPITLQGTKQRYYADPQILLELNRRTRSRTTMLSPFDSLIWNRERTETLFSFVHRLEAYTPKAKRVHGYFVMPVLSNHQIVARVDPKRDGQTLTVRRVSVEDPSFVDSVALALKEAASWVQCNEIRIEEANTRDIKSSLERSLAHL